MGKIKSKGKRNCEQLDKVIYEFPKSLNNKFPMKKLPYISTMDLIYQNSRDYLFKNKFKTANTLKKLPKEFTNALIKVKFICWILVCDWLQ